LRDEIESAFRPIGSRLAVARDRGVDQPIVQGRQRRIVQPELAHDAGPEVLDENVRPRGEPHERLASLRRLQVEDDPALAAVHRGEAGAVGAGARAHLPRRIAARRLDLDYVRAHVA
jgi:hypothetical protein